MPMDGALGQDAWILFFLDRPRVGTSLSSPMAYSKSYLFAHTRLSYVSLANKMRSCICERAHAATYIRKRYITDTLNNITDDHGK